MCLTNIIKFKTLSHKFILSAWIFGYLYGYAYTIHTPISAVRFLYRLVDFSLEPVGYTFYFSKETFRKG